MYQTIAVFYTTEEEREEKCKEKKQLFTFKAAVLTD